MKFSVKSTTSRFWPTFHWKNCRVAAPLLSFHHNVILKESYSLISLIFSPGNYHLVDNMFMFFFFKHQNAPLALQRLFWQSCRKKLPHSLNTFLSKSEKTSEFFKKNWVPCCSRHKSQSWRTFWKIFNRNMKTVISWPNKLLSFLEENTIRFCWARRMQFWQPWRRMFGQNQ